MMPTGGAAAASTSIFDAVTGGNPFEDVAEVYELSLQQLVAILRFAAQSAASPSAGPERG
jgi:uncharacterized protein (DUF433 family)